MSLLAELKSLVSSLGIPVETGVFSDKAPDEYIVLIPMDNDFDLYADNKPGVDVHSVRISLFTKGNYTVTMARVVNALLKMDLTITARIYLGYEFDTKYHHYNIDVENYYETEDL